MSKVFNFKTGFPSLLEWASAFKSKSGAMPRSVLGSTQVALEASKTLRNYEFKRMTAVDIYSGLGAWTSALKNVGFKRILALESHPHYSRWMETVASQSDGVIELLKKDGYDWETYNYLRDPKYLGELQKDDWSEVHPNIFFTGFIPKGKKGEQLLSQFICCANTKMAMHTFGRVPMVFWVPDTLYTKFTAGPGDKNRCKMSVVAEGCGEVEILYTVEEKDVYPATLYHLVAITPHKESAVKADWDVFEYVLKHLFVIRKQTLCSMIKTLGPGAEIILGRLSFDTNTPIRDLSAAQLGEVAEKFDQWPLKPKILFEDSSAFTSKIY